MKTEHFLLIAHHVGADIEKTRAFLLVAEMCGYSFADWQPRRILDGKPVEEE